MDVAEASKHGKKSTSQKLEDQKKVGQIFFGYSLNTGLNLGPVAAINWPSTTFFMHLLAKGIVNWCKANLALLCQQIDCRIVLRSITVYLDGEHPLSRERWPSRG